MFNINQSLCRVFIISFHFWRFTAPPPVDGWETAPPPTGPVNEWEMAPPPPGAAPAPTPAPAPAPADGWDMWSYMVP